MTSGEKVSVPGTILITGASSGIGRATAELFASRGWNVAATMRRPDDTDLGNFDGRLQKFRLDVTDAMSIESAVEAVLARFNRIDVLVNNAGYGLIGVFEEMRPDDVRRNVETNVLGLMTVTRAVLPAMRRQGTGRIVNLASVAGKVTLPLYSVYCATKHAVEGFSEALSFELAPLGIRVKIIEPGPIKTEFFGRSLVLAGVGGAGPYGAWAQRVFANVTARCLDIPGPELVAESIWQAATERSARLRHRPNGRLMLLGRRLTPVALHHWIVRYLLEA